MFSAQEALARVLGADPALPSRKPQFSPESPPPNGPRPNLKEHNPTNPRRYRQWFPPTERSVVSASDDAPRPLVDQSVLDRLREELAEDEGYCRVFVDNFIECLPERIDRLRLALTTGDLEGSADAVLSLKTSSQMVGAERLAGLAMDLEGAIRTDAGTSDAAVVLPRLAATFLRPINLCSDLTTHRLQAQCSLGASR